MKLKHQRSRYQAGSLTIEKRANGPDVWVYRWREYAGQRSVQRRLVVGSKKEIPTETAARRTVDSLRMDINAEAIATSTLCVREVAEHYKRRELAECKTKRAKTKAVYTQQLDKYILPHWGETSIAAVKAFRVEEWLASLLLADGTKAKTKAVVSCLYQHAMRFGWAEMNPIRSVRQGAKPQHEFQILTDEESVALLAELPSHARAMTVLAATTGLRRGELIGLKWEDVDFAAGLIHVRRSIVEGVIGEPKTRASRKPVPMEAALAYSLSRWKKETKFARKDDWVFASPFHAGKRPYSPGTIMVKIVRPAALSAGITKHIDGWHTFRRTVATLLVAQGESIKTTQETLRHATPTVTLGIYAQAVNEDRRAAQSKIASLLKLETGTEHCATNA